MTISPKTWRIIRAALLLIFVCGAIVGVFAWYKFFREVPQTFQSEEERFKYGSIGAENDRGLPYLVWLVLPRIFPDFLPGPGGYASFGVVWEEGQEIPVGFSKKTIGFPRIANNCAICHVTQYRTAVHQTPVTVAAGPGATVDVQGMIRFLAAAADDPRFNADTILDQIDLVYKLSWIDRQLYRYLIIPMTRKALREQRDQFAWMERPGKPHWGPGRDDPMNLTKYFMTDMPEDKSVGQADFPSIWNLKVRKGKGLLLNWSGDTPAVRSVIIDSALGLGARPTSAFLRRMEELDGYLSNVSPPPWPYPKGHEHAIDTALAAAGKPIYDEHCASCHDVGREYTNKVIPIDEINTDRERMDTWTQAAADEANRRVREMGIDRPDMQKHFGYISPPLDGCWLRAPYLHHGTVPNLTELLKPGPERIRVFYRGCDLYDPINVGFVSSGPEVEGKGFFRLDTSERGNGNQGHEYGTDLPDDAKKALIEYLKTL